MVRLLTTVSVLALGISTAACVKKDDDGDLALAAQAIDSSDVGSSEGNLLAGTLDGVATASAATAPTAEQAAAFIAARAPQRYTPNGCLTVNQSGAHVTLGFADCTGPRGLRTLNGQLDLDVSITAGGDVQVDATATDLGINEATIDIQSTAVYHDDGTSKTLTVTTHGEGTGGLGVALSRDGDYVVTWTDTCASIDGSWEAHIGSLTRSTDVDLERCVAMCPTGTVVHTGVGGRTLTIKFDGTATAQWAGSGGASGTIALACTE